MKIRKSNKKHRRSKNNLSYINHIARSSIPIVGKKKSKFKHLGGGFSFPIATRNLSRHEPLYPAIHARLIGGANVTYKKYKTKYNKVNKTYKGGFNPAIMGPLIDNFHYIAPVLGLAAYRYYDEIKNKKRKTYKK
jgi:hypothetical protein